MVIEEKIRNSVGRVYRKGIIIITLLSLINLIYKLIVSLINDFSILTLIAEVAIVLCGGIILLVGGNKTNEQNRYNRLDTSDEIDLCRNLKVFFFVILLSHAVSIPYYFINNHSSNVYYINYFILILEVIGAIYIYYAHKKENIYINYSFIEEQKKLYYDIVLKNIYKIVIVNIIVFLVSILLTYVLTDILLTAIWAIVLSFLFCVVSLSLIYLFLSWLDRSRYEEDTVEDLESTQITFTKTSVIIGITLIVLNFISTSLSLFQHFAISHIINNFMSMESVLGKFVLLQSNIQVYLRIFIAVIFILLLINMTRYVIENSKTNQALKIFIIFELVKLAFSYIQRFILTIMSVNENVNVYRYITSGNSILNNLISLTNGVIILILILMITKEFKVNQVVIVIPSFILFQKLVVILMNRFINLNFWNVLTNQISFILGTALTFVYMLVNKSKRLDLIKYNF